MFGSCALYAAGRVVFAHAATLLIASLTVACARDTSPESGGEADEVLFSESPPAWFDAYRAGLAVAPDGQRALFDVRRLVDLTAGTEIPLGGGLDQVRYGTFDHLSRPLVMGRRGDETGWFRIDDPDGEAERLASLPADAFVVWAPSGDRIAYVSTGATTVSVGPAEGGAEPTAHPLPGPASAAAWADARLLVLVTDERGVGSLHSLDPVTGEVSAVAADLDGPWRGSTIAVSGDGRFAYLPLASPGAPDPEARHDPDADRDLDIYEIDLGTGDRRPVVDTPAEELGPAVADGALHWVAIESWMDAVLVPIAGGEARVVAEGVQLPTWRPDGRAIGVTTGDWRLADWALNLDGGVVEIDAAGRAVSPIAPIITGYHEDFSPVWSPDGTWIAYHSHRSPGPVAAYLSEGSTDDIYVRRADAPMAEEIRLTDFGLEVGTPDWAPDGRRLLLDSWDEDEGRGASSWIVEMDPATGSPLGRTRVPPPEAARGAPAMGAWSPAREEIAIVYAGGAGGSQLELWILAPDGSNARRVAAYTGPRYGGVDWSPDGETLIYSAHVGEVAQLFSIARSGGEPRRLTDEAASLMHPQVSPDGRWVAATRMRHERRILRRPG